MGDRYRCSRNRVDRTYPLNPETSLDRPSSVSTTVSPRNYPRGLATRLVEVFRFLQLDVPPVPVKVEGGTALDYFARATYSDDCADANLREVVHYLYGCRGLQIPAEWRPLMPTQI